MTFSKTILVVIGMLGYTLAVTMKLDESVGNASLLPISGFGISESNEVLPVTVFGYEEGTVIVIAELNIASELMKVKEFNLAIENKATTGINMRSYTIYNESGFADGVKLLLGHALGVEVGNAIYPYENMTLSQVVEDLNNKSNSGSTVVEYIKYKDGVATMFHLVLEGITESHGKLNTTTELKGIPNGSAVIREGGVDASEKDLEVRVLGFTISHENRISVVKLGIDHVFRPKFYNRRVTCVFPRKFSLKNLS